MLAQIVRFGGVGGLATLLHVAVALAAQRSLPVTEQQANLLGFLAAVTLSYIGHARVTFRAPVGSARQVQRFAVLSLLGLATSSGTVWLVDGILGLGFLVAMAVVALVVPTASFLAMRAWVFRRSTADGTTLWPGLALSTAATLAAAAVFAGQRLTNDVAWYLIATRRWLEGGTLYETILEVNPPLNFYLTAPAILLADGLGISDVAGQYLVVWSAVFASLCWCSIIIQTAFALSPRRQAALLLGVALAMIVTALDSLAQREFYLVVLMMPWLLAQAPQQPPPLRRELATAAFAAVGMCLKPHFILFPLAVTLDTCLRRRSLRPILAPANLVFLAIGLAYLAFFALVHPTYLSDILPTAALVYDAYTAPPDVVLGIALHEVLFLALPVIIALTDRAARWNPHPFTAAALGGLFSYLTQAKGFGYHLIPFMAFGLLACLMILLSLRRIGPFAAASAIAAAGIIGIGVRDGFHSNISADQITRIGQDLGGFDSLMVLTPHVFAGPPTAFESGAEWISRYLANWLVPGALNRLAATDCAQEPDLCARLRAIANRNRSDNIADIIAGQPDLLVVDKDSDYFATPQFDWLAFMAEDPAWAAVFADYRFMGETTRYLYYLRNP